MILTMKKRRYAEEKSKRSNADVQRHTCFLDTSKIWQCPCAWDICIKDRLKVQKGTISDKR